MSEISSMLLRWVLYYVMMMSLRLRVYAEKLHLPSGPKALSPSMMLLKVLMVFTFFLVIILSCDSYFRWVAGEKRIAANSPPSDTDSDVGVSRRGRGRQPGVGGRVVQPLYVVQKPRVAKTVA